MFGVYLFGFSLLVYDLWLGFILLCFVMFVWFGVNRFGVGLLAVMLLLLFIVWWWVGLFWGLYCFIIY